LTTPTSASVVVVTSELPEDDPEADMDLDRWRLLAERTLATEHRGPGELNLLFVDEPAMTDLNTAHMGGDGPTDVLAFPIDAEEAPGGDLPVLLGDVVVCPGVARRYATANGVEFADEVALLVVHGILHVLGHDHAEPDETALMKSREQALLAAHHGASR
jgi:probable rRNA maturation factor